MIYNHLKIERKWQNYWAKNQTFKADNDSQKPKFYILDMFPYPSGMGLHVGHPLGYIASDIYARYKRHQAYNVLHPMGYDSFGLPAEQYAIQTGQHPEITTKNNINRYRKQLDRMGFSFDWSRQIFTSEPSYYKWTQWIFTELFDSWYDDDLDKARPIEELTDIFKKQGNKNLHASCSECTPSFDAKQWGGFSQEEQQDVLLNYRLAFLSDTEVNWCPNLGTVLANDEIIDGLSERGGHPVVKKKMRQWSMRITAYAERLLEGLERINWSESLKESQRHWIGKSTGIRVKFDIKNNNEQIEVFTTRVDTLFGVTFIVLAPENELVEKLISPEKRETLSLFKEKISKQTEIERMAENKKPSGFFTGAYATHPLTQKPIPIWVGDYVLATYGTGAVMAVPCGDERDFKFAKYYNLPIVNIFEGVDISKNAFSGKENFKLTHSFEFDGLNYKEATNQIAERLTQKKCGTKEVNYRIRDAVFSRQRYWGEPFPVYYKNGLPQIISKEHLPVRLPKVEEYLPTESGKPPLGNAKKWAWDIHKNQVVDTLQIDHKKVFPLELNTMPGWAGSSWYFNRYMDSDNQEVFASKQALDYWKQVDLYMGGSEHATGHLLYSRFWQKFLFDRGYVPVDEYAIRLVNQGMILGESAFVYKDKLKEVYYSKNQIEGKSVLSIRIDISFIEGRNVLKLEQFKKCPNYEKATFITERDNTFLVTREVEKMSKSKFNVVNPDNIYEQYGADTLRMYEMFLGPIEQSKPWNTLGITGVYSFIKKLWKLYFDEEKPVVDETPPKAESLKTIHKAIKKVNEDIENFSFNTSISAFMICVNELTYQKCHSRKILEPLAVLISPFAPHIAEELWQHLGHNESISYIKYPSYDPSYLEESEKEYPVSFNGKVRFKAKYKIDIPIAEIEADILSNPKTKTLLSGKEVKKVIVVPNKIINIVC